ncbi:MAG: adenine deaminase [Candidatus Muirbacterium halophilum]|nr:adenine deaminase [Candidatus Muirbacterium halophilum]MCK9475667.1 adenine deaminase [Candidatus Muirbacterium halophilum]
MNKRRLIRVASGKEKADLVLKNVNLINTLSGEIYITDVAVCDGYIAGIVPGYKGIIEKDCKGKYLSPGFIDGHVHIESSMVSPSEFAKAIVPRGTTTVIADPHEIANVKGLKGIDYILSFVDKIPLNIFIMLPSCVPSTNLETSGAVLSAEKLSKYHDNPNVLGLGEFMNYPGVINTCDDVMDKLEMFHDKIIDGHAPMVTGMNLCAYRAAGVTSEHECTTVEEALEKLRMGMYIMIREGSATKNLLDLMPLLNKFNERFCFFSTDDRHPDDLIQEGHIDNMVKMLVIEQGNIVRAVRLASKNAAEYFGLKELGSIAPGYKADMLVIEDFSKMIIKEVYKDGKLVAQNGKAIFENIDIVDESVFSSINTIIEPEKIKIKVNNKSIINVIEIIPSQIITKRIKVKPLIKNKYAQSDVENDILKFCVFERHNGTGNIGTGFVKGLGLKKGAIGTSVSHDSHNINVIGTNDKDIIKCAEIIKENNGGQAVVCDGKVLDVLPLPIAGLMSLWSLEKVSEKIKSLHSICKELGVSLKDPFITMAFLALPVIPDIKLTDKGLVDVTKFKFIDLVEEL